MGKLILNVLLVVLVAHSLALVGFLGYGAMTNRFDYDKREQYLATWRGEKLVPPPQEVVVEEKQETPQQAGARIMASQVEREVLNREMELYAQLLRNKEVTIDVAQIKLEKDIEDLKVKREEFAELMEENNEKIQDENFRKALKNYSIMKPKYVKDDFMQMEDKEVIRYLAEMKSDTATKILEQFKQPEEQSKRLRLMRLLENYGVINLDKKTENKEENLVSQS